MEPDRNIEEDRGATGPSGDVENDKSPRRRRGLLHANDPVRAVNAEEALRRMRPSQSEEYRLPRGEQPMYYRYDGARPRQDEGVHRMDEPNRQEDHTTHYRRPRVLPDKYNGQGSWGEYLSHFQICAELNEWNERERAQYLSFSLRGAASQFLDTLHDYQNLARKYVGWYKELILKHPLI